MKTIYALAIAVLAIPAFAQQYQGQVTVNPYAPNAISPYTRPSHNGPHLYSSQGEYRGRLNNNQYDPESVSNPYGRYGSKYSPDSISNKYGAGNPYSSESPNNPYGSGLRAYE